MARATLRKAGAEVTRVAYPRRVRRRAPPPDERLFAAKKRARVPFAFFLDELEQHVPISTRPMFGCTAIYVDDKIVAIVREKDASPEDNGIWIATTREHHESLRKELPSMRSIVIFGGGSDTGWQVLPMGALEFEDDAMRACALIARGDPRIGKIPKARRPRKKPKKLKP
jgi:hypothetical protein